MNQLRVTHDAERDLDEIWLYIARDNIAAADRLLDELTSRFRLLASSPRAGRLRDDLRPGLRSLAVGNYVIFYRLGKSRVRILRVIHGARDIPVTL